MGNDYNDCVLTYGKLTLAYQTGTYANFGVTMTSQNTSPYNTYLLPHRCGQGKTPTNLCRAESPPQQQLRNNPVLPCRQSIKTLHKESVHLPCNWN